ncbi:MAG: glutamate--tRNA ligase [Thermoplasmata archaeon]|nr:MAG: glutamate--tRNA ligase [Thermoplasmata archaeon]
MSIEEIARKYALLNAVEFNGKANIKAVMGKVMAEFKGNAKEVISIVKSIVDEVNALSLDKQKKELEKLGVWEREKSKKREGLPPLPFAEKGKVVTRFPPEPNGYLHIGHAKAAIVDYEYARMYDGTFILRFDDTNPVNESIEFYDAQKEDLRWLGIEWDKEYRTSDNLPKHYELAEMLIKKGNAYICTCSEKVIRESRKDGRECACRKNMTPEKWREFFSMEEGKAVLRLKGDMKSENTAMRDPTLFRIIDHPHPIHGEKYRIWPTYDFYGAVEDSLSGVTHPFRTKEYELRDEVYFYLLDCLNLRKPHLMEFARLSIQGMPVSKRKIKPLIEKKLVMGWDDPRLPTLRGLRRRGICAEAIKQFVLSQGISKAESVVTFDQVEAINRKILDSKAKRYFFVPNPVKLLVKNAPEKEVELKHHPSFNLGSRRIKTSDTFFIPSQDANELEEKEIFRLKDLYNVKVIKKGKEIIGEFASEKLMPGTKKIQWVGDEYIKMEVIIPEMPFLGDKFNEKSLEEVKGYAEKQAENIANGEIVQFERFGFVRIEKNGGMKGILAHK